MSDFLTIINDNINSIINSLIPKCFINKRCIIAGGMPLSIYNKYIRYDKDMWNSLPREAVDVTAVKYSDVDIWIFDPENPDSEDFLDVIRRPLNIGDLILNDERWFTRSKTSKFAATYTANSDSSFRASNVFQLMLSGIRNDIPADEAIKGLLDTFDLDICKVAWHDGVLYAHKSIVNYMISSSFDFSKYQMNKISNTDLLSPGELAYMSLRYKKYSARYGLDPSKNICNFVYTAFKRCSERNSELEKESEAKQTPYVIGSKPPVINKIVTNQVPASILSGSLLSNSLSSASLYNNDDSWGGTRLVKTCADPNFFEWIFSLKNLEDKESKMLYYVGDERYKYAIKSKLDISNVSPESLNKTHDLMSRGKKVTKYNNFKVVTSN